MSSDRLLHFWELYKKKVLHKPMPLLSVSDLLTTSQVAVTRYRRNKTSEVEMEDRVADKNAINNTLTPSATYCVLPCYLRNLQLPDGTQNISRKQNITFSSYNSGKTVTRCPPNWYLYTTNQNVPQCNKTGNNDVLHHLNQYPSTIKVRGTFHTNIK
jgi:hypothetical protein